MITLKADYSRPIDRVIDYFGERRPRMASLPSPKPVKAALVRAA